MNINLQNFLSDSAALSNNRNVSTDGSSQNIQNTDNTGEISLEDLVTGDVFSGEILDINNYNVDILLDNNQHINAVMQQALELNIGDKLLFQVKDKSDAQIVIRPVANNQVSMELVMKSLLAAGLTINDKNTAVVKELINNGQPIDRQSITNMIKITSIYGSENIDKLVDMTKNGIEINRENLEQYDLYSTSRHQLAQTLRSIENEIVSLVTDACNNSEELKLNVSNAISLLEDLSKVFDENEMINNENIKNEKSVNGTIVNTIADIPNEETAKNTDKTDIFNNTGEQFKNVDEQKTNTGEIFESETREKNMSGVFESNQEINANDRGKEILNLSDSLKNAAAALKYVADNAIEDSEIQNFVKSPELKDKIRKIFSERLFLEPEKMEENKENIKDELGKVYDRLEKLADAVKNNSVAAKNENMSSAADNLKNNLNFMNELNHIDSYVQLPIKFSESNKNGDLYVYNRRNRRKSDKDTLTAFLHLDMEYLGATDVNIAMEKNSVTTKFTLDNAESQKLVAEHIGELTKKLDDMGYNVKITTELKKQTDGTDNNALLPITVNNDSAVSIKRYTLDIRT